jgi:hypothetical protein
MPGKRNFENQIAGPDRLRQEPDEAVRAAALRKALANRNNFIAGKAANLVSEFRLTGLIPELIAAIDRFFDNPVKTDPQCWAKNALSRALAALDYQEPAVFLRGMQHIQMEPVWGGQSDTAGTLRATCAFALVQCRSLTDSDLLAHLVDMFADKDKAVRAEVAHAIELVGSPSAALLLRLRAVLGTDEAEVLGACYGGVLRIEGSKAIPWVSRFLSAGDDSAAEAALAIAGTHSAEGFHALRDCFAKSSNPRSADPRSDATWFRSVLLSAIALTRQDAATEFLLDLVRTESLDAEPAIEALLRSMPPEAVVKSLERLIAGNARLERAFATHRKPER